MDRANTIIMSTENISSAPESNLDIISQPLNSVSIVLIGSSHVIYPLMILLNCIVAKSLNMLNTLQFIVLIRQMQLRFGIGLT